jgi:hypothetical protein
MGCLEMDRAWQQRRGCSQPKCALFVGIAQEFEDESDNAALAQWSKKYQSISFYAFFQCINRMLATAIIIKCGCWDDVALGMVSGMMLIVAEKAFQCSWLLMDYTYQLICSMGTYSSPGSPTTARVEYIHSWGS